MAVDLREVVDDGAVVALWPGVPLELQSVASLDRDGVGSRLCGLVASDVRGAEVCRLNETFGKSACDSGTPLWLRTVVLVESEPAGGGGLLVGRKVEPVLRAESANESKLEIC